MATNVFTPPQEDWMEVLDTFLSGESGEPNQASKSVLCGGRQQLENISSYLPPEAIQKLTPSQNTKHGRIIETASTVREESKVQTQDCNNPNREPNAESNAEVNAESKALARSERKRTREKKRRCDVNAQFADLTTLLRRVEEEDENEDDDVEKRVTSSNPTNRVDLIARTIYMMERIHEGNIKRRKKISKLQQDIMDAEKRAKVAEEKLQKVKLDGKQQMMMMVPMMVPSSNGSSSSGCLSIMPPSNNLNLNMPPGFPGQGHSSFLQPGMPYCPPMMMGGQMSNYFPGMVKPAPYSNPMPPPLPGKGLKGINVDALNYAMPPKLGLVNPTPGANLAHCA